MNCTNCRNPIEQEDRYCSECGEKTKSGAADRSQKITIQGKNTFKKSDVHIGDIYTQTQSDTERTAFIDRSYIKPLEILGSPVKTSWFVVSGVVGFLGSIASMFGVMGNTKIFLFFISAIILLWSVVYGVALWKSGFARLRWFNLESSIEGEIFLTKVEGDCPKCDGTLKLRDLKISQNQFKTYVRCSRNGDHIWGFDPTVL